jgi:hypothetical protein
MHVTYCDLHAAVLYRGAQAVARGASRCVYTLALLMFRLKILHSPAYAFQVFTTHC